MEQLTLDLDLPNFWLDTYKAFATTISYFEGGFPVPVSRAMFLELTGIRITDNSAVDTTLEVV